MSSKLEAVGKNISPLYSLPISSVPGKNCEIPKGAEQGKSWLKTW
jgi:hypothetical protein